MTLRFALKLFNALLVGVCRSSQQYGTDSSPVVVELHERGCCGEHTYSQSHSADRTTPCTTLSPPWANHRSSTTASYRPLLSNETVSVCSHRSHTHSTVNRYYSVAPHIVDLQAFSASNDAIDHALVSMCGAQLLIAIQIVGWLRFQACLPALTVSASNETTPR